MKDLNEIYLVVYREKYCGEFCETYKELFTSKSDAESFIKEAYPNDDVSDIKLFVCHEQNINYLKDK